MPKPVQTTPHSNLARIASKRYGVVSVHEALSCGLTRSQISTLIQRGEWSRPRRGVLVSTAAPPSWNQQAAVATVLTSGMLSHRAAAHLHKLDGISSPPIELLLHKARNRPDGKWIAHLSDQISSADRVTVRGLPTTSISRTLVDLGAVVSDDDLEKALDSAFRQGLSTSSLVKTLHRLERPGQRGCASLRRVLARPDRNGPIPDSHFERLVERACLDAGLPPMQRQFVVRDKTGTAVARLDMAWPEIRLGVEADSVAFHSTTAQIRSDAARDLVLASLGWDLCYVGWAHVMNPASFTPFLLDAYMVRLARF